MSNKHIVISLFIFSLLTSCSTNCNDVIDIYHSDVERYDAYSLTCPYTKTPKGCSDCGNTEVRRSELAAVKRGYELKGVLVPLYFNRTSGKIYEPLDNNYLN